MREGSARGFQQFGRGGTFGASSAPDMLGQQCCHDAVAFVGEVDPVVAKQRRGVTQSGENRIGPEDRGTFPTDELPDDVEILAVKRNRIVIG